MSQSSSAVRTTPSSAPASAVHPSSPSPAPRPAPFWLGGAASMGAACCSHPLDLIKVRLQCVKTGEANQKGGIILLVKNIIRTDGVLSLYAGLSASLMRQATYSTVRFGCYESMKSRRLSTLRAAHAARGLPRSSYPRDLPMIDSIVLCMLAGALGGVAGNPPDLVNVRMQNDKKLAPDLRRNYKNVFQGLASIVRTDGVLSLWNGWAPNVTRAMLMTTGQLASYDLFKGTLVHHFHCSDKNIGTHLTASCMAGVVATIITQPVDVVKTRMMNASCPVHSVLIGRTVPEVQLGTVAVVKQMIAQEGFKSFFKGFLPALTRLGPHTIATFIFLEQLKKMT